MTILITGGAGYIGSHIALTLLDHGQEVVVIDNLSTGHAALVPQAAAFVQADIADTDRMRQTLRDHAVRAVIHCAGSTIAPQSISRPLEYYDNNSTATLRLLQAMRAEGVARLIFSSTASVYRENAAQPIPEDAPIAPATPYGRSKRMAELMIQDMATANGLSFAILRYFNVAGADPQGRSGHLAQNATHLIKVAVEAATGARPDMPVHGTDWPTPDGSCIRDFIHVSDLAEIHRLVLHRLEADARDLVLNCGYGRGHSVLEVIETVRRLSGADVPIRHTPRRDGDISSVVADPSRMRALLAWQPRHADLDEIVGTALAWERQAGGAG